MFVSRIGAKLSVTIDLCVYVFFFNVYIRMQMNIIIYLQILRNSQLVSEKHVFRYDHAIVTIVVFFAIIWPMPMHYINWREKKYNVFQESLHRIFNRYFWALSNFCFHGKSFGSLQWLFRFFIGYSFYCQNFCWRWMNKIHSKNEHCFGQAQVCVWEREEEKTVNRTVITAKVCQKPWFDISLRSKCTINFVDVHLHRNRIEHMKYMQCIV